MFTLDPAIERWAAFRDGYENYFKFTRSNTLFIGVTLLALPLATFYVIHRDNRKNVKAKLDKGIEILEEMKRNRK